MPDSLQRRRLRRRLQTFLVIFLSIVFVMLILIVILKDNEYERSYSALIEENKLEITGFKMVYILDNQNYINLNAETASAERISTSVFLDNISLRYSGKDVLIEAKADKGSYELQRMLRAYGNVNGFINDMEFTAGEDSSLIYDYDEKKGSIDNNIILKQGKNELTAGKAMFNVNNNFIEFVDNVVLQYYPEAK